MEEAKMGSIITEDMNSKPVSAMSMDEPEMKEESKLVEEQKQP
jgi:hypothetical protein